jgi:uncharacterized OB-fold protein
MSDAGEVLSAVHVIEYPYRRSVGPVLGRFFTALRERRIEGARTAAGKVIVPPTEYDPDTGEATTGMVEVGPAGEVVGWTWVAEPRAKQPLDQPFAYALIRLDGADVAMLHAVDAGSESKMSTGLRVRPRWRAETVGEIGDIECFEPEA